MRFRLRSAAFIGRKDMIARDHLHADLCRAVFKFQRQCIVTVPEKLQIGRFQRNCAVFDLHLIAAGIGEQSAVPADREGLWLWVRMDHDTAFAASFPCKIALIRLYHGIDVFLVCDGNIDPNLTVFKGQH